MKKLLQRIFFTFLLIITVNSVYAGTVITAIADGQWKTGGTWSGGAVPTTGDIALIPAGITVTYTTGYANGGNEDWANPTIYVYGTLKFASGSAVINGTPTNSLYSPQFNNAANVYFFSGSKFYDSQNANGFYLNNAMSIYTYSGATYQITSSLGYTDSEFSVNPVNSPVDFTPAIPGTITGMVAVNSNNPNNLIVHNGNAPPVVVPIAITNTATNVTANSATLGGNVYSTTENSTVTFDYGTSSNLSTFSTSTSSAVNANVQNGAVSINISNLSGGTTYYYRLRGANTAGAALGTIQSFTTPLSSDNTLSGLSLSAGSLSPSFSGGTTSYTAQEVNSTTSITITPTKNQANASIKVNGTVVTSGTASGSINLNIGDNAQSIVVTAQDGTTKTYTVTINRPKAPQTITFNDLPAKTYGNADFAPGATASSGLTVSYSSDNLNVATIVSGQVHIIGAGTANITASQGGDGNTAAATSVVQILTVSQSAQTITFNAIAAKTYGAADFAPGATASSSLTVAYSSDNLNVATIVNGQIHIVGAGTANITASQSGDANTAAATSIVQSLTVNKGAITITAAAKTKIFGNDDPALTYSATGVANGDVPAGALERAAGRYVGSYAITQGSLSYGNNYSVTYVGANLTITKRPVTIQPQDQTKVYGAPDPNYPYIITGGPAPGDGMTGVFTRTDGEQVGIHSILIGTKRPYDLELNTGESDASNYDITFIPGKLTITPKPVTVTADAQTKTYGDADPELTYSNDAVVDGDSFTGALARTAGENAGNYAINQGTLTLGSNYTINFNSALLSIGKRTVNVTANAKTKFYGDTDPVFDYTAGALAFTDSFTGSLSRDAGEDVGDHPINVGSLAVNSNYNLNFTGANLSIGKATLTYTATPVSRPFETANPAFTGSVSGFVNGDTQATATTGTLSFTSDATADSAPGNYVIVGSGLSAGNYNLIQAGANNTAFTITASTDATLSALRIDQGNLAPAFDSSQEYYGTGVINSITSFNLSLTQNDPYASIAVNGQPFTSGSTKNYQLDAGSNNFYIAVTAQDGSVKNYTVNIFRAYDANNFLLGISLSGVSFSPAFNIGTVNYTATVGNEVSSTNVSGTAISATTNVFVNGNNVTQNGAFNYPLQVGDNYINIIGKAQNGDERTYTVLVTRAQSPDATLSAIGVSNGTFNTPFVSSTHVYSVTVSPFTENTTITATANDGGAAITVNGNAYNSFGGSIMSLDYGNNIATIAVTSQDGLNTIIYTVNVIRQRSSDAALNYIAIPNGGSINETFNPAVFDYTADVADSTYTGLSLTISRSNINATVKVNGVDVADPLHYFMALHGGENTFHIVTTSQDTSATSTYNLVVTRAGQAPPLHSPVANLAALTISGGPGSSFSQNFNFSQVELTTVNAPNNDTSVSLIPVSENEVSTVTVEGVVVPYDNASALLPISLGDNVFTVIVTSEDGAHTKTYTVHVNRLPPSAISTLRSLRLDNGTLSPTFNNATLSYSTSILGTISKIKITPRATDAGATITVNGQPVTSSESPSVTVPLVVGHNSIAVVVTSPDGSNHTTYTIDVLRDPESYATATVKLDVVSVLTITQSTPTLLSYTTSVAPGVTRVKLIATAKGDYAGITVNGAAVSSGVASDYINLNATGTTDINTVVTGADGITNKTYLITVSRIGSSDAGLSKLAISPTAAIVAVSNTATIYNRSASVAAGTTLVNILPAANDAGATITMNGAPVISGGSIALPLNATGTTTANILVTAADGVSTKTYILVISKAGSSDASLSSLALNPTANITAGATVGSVYNRSASVAAGITSVNIKATASDAGATIQINGNVTVSGSVSAPILLTGASTTITTVVTAADGVTTKTYVLVISKTGSSDASLAKLTITPASPITSTGNAAPFYYRAATIDAATSSIRVIATANDAGATIKVNTITANSGVATDPIITNAGGTLVNIVVTAGDGVTTKTYALTINRPGQAMFSVHAPSDAITFVAQPTPANIFADVFVHHAVSPTGDGINDFLQIDGIEAYKDNNLTIVNQSGKRVFQVAGYDNAVKVFTGRNSEHNSSLPSGTYFYVLSYKVGAEVKNKSGYFVLKN